MAFPFLLAAAAVGTGLSIYGQIKGAEADADAMMREATARELEATEILKRSKINQEILQEEGEELISQQEGFFARSGVTMVGSPLLVLERTAHRVAREKANMQMEAEFRAAQLRSGAAISRDMAGQTRQAGFIKAAGTALTGVASMVSAKGTNTGSSKKSSLLLSSSATGSHGTSILRNYSSVSESI